MSVEQAASGTQSPQTPKQLTTPTRDLLLFNKTTGLVPFAKESGLLFSKEIFDSMQSARLGTWLKQFWTI